MNNRLFFAFILFISLNSTYASETDWQLSVLGENMENGHAASISIQTGDFLYGGLSLNYIDSDIVIQDDNRKTIYPVLLFMGLKYPSKIAPYIEAAVDLPELIFDELFDNDSQNSIDLTDYYLSAGLKLSLSDKYTLSIYAKKYVFKYQEATIFTTNKVRINSYGAGITMHF